MSKEELETADAEIQEIIEGKARKEIRELAKTYLEGGLPVYNLLKSIREMAEEVTEEAIIKHYGRENGERAIASAKHPLQTD